MTDPELKIHPSLKPFALAIGALCQEWAELEEKIRSHLIKLSGMPGDQTSEAIINCMDFRSQLTALKIGAVARFENDRCVDAIVEAVNYIDNVLRIRRNRYVHDLWFPAIEDWGVDKVTMVTKVHRPQAHQPLELKHADVNEENIDDLINTVEEIRSHGFYLNAILSYYGHPDWSPEDILSNPPPRRFLPSRQEKPR